MIALKLLFVLASLVAQAVIFHEPGAHAKPAPAEARVAASAAPDTGSGSRAAASRSIDAGDLSPAESDRSKTGEACALR